MMLEKLYQRARKPSGRDSQKSTGHWFPVKVIPDLVAGEVFNLGVGFADENGELHARLLERLGGFDCLYGDRLQEEDMAFLIQSLREAMPSHVTEPSDLPAPSPHIIFGEWQPASGKSAQEVINSLYQQIVSLEPREKTEGESEKTESLSTKMVRANVFKAMRNYSDFADNIIAESPEWVVETGETVRQKRILDMPLRNSNRFGTIISAGYKTPTTRDANLLRGITDLETALRMNPKDIGGAFILRPRAGTPGFDEQILGRIDNDIDNLAWKMRSHDKMLFEAEEDTDRMAKIIINWAEVA